MSPDTMTKDERSCLIYIECCCVDYGGMLAGDRLNSDDHAAIEKFKAEGLIFSGRIPAKLLSRTNTTAGAQNTNWATLTPKGWDLAHQLRRGRALQIGPRANAIYAELRERGIDFGATPAAPKEPT